MQVIDQEKIQVIDKKLYVIARKIEAIDEKCKPTVIVPFKHKLSLMFMSPKNS